ncbi:bacterial transcriptional activator domain-containing protein [Frankia sp. AiPa1]|nr:bacterial transcriptional activator domain-containing protein [Frankia sp. AiPa1]
MYDSLWRIADRALGDGARWPQIWALNHGVVQADGHALTQPALIRPGWILHLPTQSTPTAPSTSPAPSHPSPSATASPPVTSRPATPAPATSTPALPSTPPSAASRPAARPATPTPAPSHPPAVHASPPAAPAPTRSPGIQLPSGAYLGVGAVALVMVAVFSVRLWRRRHYVPGSGIRDDLDDGPVIRELALAYDAATAPPDNPDDGDEPAVPRRAGDPHATGRRHAAHTAAAHTAPPGRRHVGTSPDGTPLALDLAATRGLGLIGPGADDAIRALLLALLADRHQPDSTPVEILLPAADAQRLLGEDPAVHAPQRLHVVPDLPTLLDRLEAEVVTRARRAAAGEDTGRSTLVVLAAPDQTTDRRLQAVLDNGSSFDVLGILYGQWRPGGTARIRPDGVIGAASPTLTSLVGSRLFTLPAADTTDLLHLLADADSPARNQEAYRQANPPQGPPPPPPTSAPPPDKPAAPPPENPPRSDDTPETAVPSAKRGSTPAPRETLDAQPAPDAAPSGPQSPPTTATPLLLTLLDRLQLQYQAEPDRGYQPVDGIGAKGREILAYLSIHPDGASRTAIIDALWPDDGKPQRQRDNRFYAAISQLRRTLTAAANLDVLTQQNSRWQLRRDLLTVDLWQARDALVAYRQATTTTDRATAVLRLTAVYTGNLADELAGAWAESHREHLRREAVDALASITTSLADADPRRLQFLDLLRRHDPYNEQPYLQIAQTQSLLGQHDAVAATHRQLVAALAELGEQPTPETERRLRTLSTPSSPGAQTA